MVVNLAEGGESRAYNGIAGVPDFECVAYHGRRTKYCVLIPVINEGERIRSELRKAVAGGVDALCDIVVCDGGSTDGSMEGLQKLGVNALLVKRGPGRQGAQLRMGFWWALRRGYEGFVTVDGNDKDGVEGVARFVQKLDEGYDFVQGSRFLRSGEAVNTPLLRLLAVRLLHAPVVSLAARHRFTDTTNAFRAHSRRYLEDARVAPFRDVFGGYELLAYLSVRAGRLGMRVCEVPVSRAYPKAGATPTKISAFRGNASLLRALFAAALGRYDPPQGKNGDGSARGRG